VVWPKGKSGPELEGRRTWEKKERGVPVAKGLHTDLVPRTNPKKKKRGTPTGGNVKGGGGGGDEKRVGTVETPPPPAHPSRAQDPKKNSHQQWGEKSQNKTKRLEKKPHRVRNINHQGW